MSGMTVVAAPVDQAVRSEAVGALRRGARARRRRAAPHGRACQVGLTAFPARARPVWAASRGPQAVLVQAGALGAMIVVSLAALVGVAGLCLRLAAGA